VPKSVLFPDNNSEKNTNIPTTSIKTSIWKVATYHN
jgi:hypothetical protein